MLDRHCVAMLDTLRAALPAFAKVEEHSGRFSLDDVKRVSAKTPALLLSCLSVGDVRSAPAGRTAVLRMAAFVLVGAGRDASGNRVDKDHAALTLVDGVISVLDSEAWELAPPEGVEADNLYSASGKVTVALWAVTWDQPVELGTPQAALESLAEFKTMGVVWNTASPDGTPEMEDNSAVREE